MNSVDDLTAPYEFIKDKLTTSYIDIDSLELSNDSSYGVFQLNKDDEIPAMTISLNQNKETWKTKNNIFLTIDSGKIVNTRGLKYDFSIIYAQELTDFDKEYSGYIKFNDPETEYLDITSTFNTIKKGFITLNSKQQNIEYVLIEESFNVPLIKWKGKNYYWLDNDGEVLKIKQILNPFKDTANLQLIKK